MALRAHDWGKREVTNEMSVAWRATWLKMPSVLCRMVSEKKGMLRERYNIVLPLMDIIYKLLCISYTHIIPQIS